MREGKAKYTNKISKYMEDRKEAKPVKIWVSSDSEEDYDPELLFQSYGIESNLKKSIEISNSRLSNDSNLKKPISTDETMKLLNHKKTREALSYIKAYNEDDEEIEFDETHEFGPQPIKIELDKKEEKKFYAGTSLLPGEAQLFAHYVQNGKRIPRRGEVGLSCEDIERFEKLGYVMSGNRHKKMNNARLKKEAQIYTAEEKRALAIYNLEEQQRKELNIINEMKFMWQTSKDDEANE